MSYETPTPDHRPNAPQRAAGPLVRFDSDSYARFNEQIDAELTLLESRWKDFVTQASLDPPAGGRCNQIVPRRW